jgi:hypothetical protein
MFEIDYSLIVISKYTGGVRSLNSGRLPYKISIYFLYVSITFYQEEEDILIYSSIIIIFLPC